MEVKNRPILEAKVGEKTFELVLPEGSTLGELHDALFQMRSFVIDRIKEANEMNQKSQEEVKTEETKAE
ncbi:hypothetical protein UFOVP1357_20 [uncultured Caudovirales phage]|uniref:Uncharacterized protein n=1 Tax=uncultured Caudovirales phage TaxID=2100421 RepID=A0A6J5KYH5_9CAUD|nr:hypothetical protein UFOVP18_53 [uncultured Caudovirales phage]CAB4127111.1 hypothetical protein UFOVP82_55 [uncultured Caudovirales phage]CAB4132657.1 hypothetical protein UFOVP258_46 [uncultured Caudovirales phage]CAB4146546.1 hypothetical protein UFOVP502_38 [uncultured Caudovirales phage]CAB4199925.1 hypothetical protein UFOVP1357_20 [uncultured Caudovirales phage]